MRHIPRSFRNFLCIVLFTCLSLIGCKQNSPIQTQPNVAPGIERLSQVTGMTPNAKQIFFAQHPKLIPAESFYNLCGQSGQGHESSVILGCFIHRSGEGQIWIQSITDQRLQGTMEVVAAHEMLHAAFSQLTPSEITALAPKLEKAFQYYENASTGPILRKYQNQSPQVFINELHSYLGTELQNLHDSELEAYYQQYFTDRKSLVNLVHNSQNELYAFETSANKLQSEIKSLESFIQTEKASLARAVDTIKQSERNLTQQQNSVDSQITQTSRLIREGNFDALEQFDFAQQRLSDQAQYIENMIQDYQRRTLEYEEKVNLYNEKVNEYKSLIKNRESVLQTLQRKA